MLGLLKHSALVLTILIFISCDGLRLSQHMEKIHLEKESRECKTLQFEGLPGRMGNKLGHIFLALYRAAGLNVCSLSFKAQDADQLKPVLDIPLEVSLTDHVQSKSSVSYGPPDMWWDVAMDDRSGLVRTREMMQKFFAPHKMPCPKEASTPPNDVVMHMRSGDVWELQKAWNVSYHLQPPCSWYANVMEKGNNGSPFDNAKIVTETTETDNPCIAMMKDRFPGRVSVQKGTLSEDYCTLVSARKLAWSMSSLPIMLTAISTDIEEVFIPFARDRDTKYSGGFEYWWQHYAWSEIPMPYKQHLYTFPAYDPKHALFKDVLSYSTEQMILRTIEAGPRPNIPTQLGNSGKTFHIGWAFLEKEGH